MKKQSFCAKPLRERSAIPDLSSGSGRISMTIRYEKKKKKEEKKMLLLIGIGMATGRMIGVGVQRIFAMTGTMLGTIGYGANIRGRWLCALSTRPLMSLTNVTKDNGAKLKSATRCH